MAVFLSAIGKKSISGIAGDSGTLKTNPGAASLALGNIENIYIIICKDAANPVVNIGTTPGGTEIWNAVQLINGIYSVVEVIPIVPNTTLYFSGITGNTKFIVKTI